MAETIPGHVSLAMMKYLPDLFLCICDETLHWMSLWIFRRETGFTVKINSKAKICDIYCLMWCNKRVHGPTHRWQQSLWESRKPQKLIFTTPPPFFRQKYGLAVVRVKIPTPFLSRNNPPLSSSSVIYGLILACWELTVAFISYIYFSLLTKVTKELALLVFSIRPPTPFPWSGPMNHPVIASRTLTLLL